LHLAKAASPACTELEMIMLDWVGRMIGLPDDFLPFQPDGKGGGVIQVIESTHLSYVCNASCLLRARRASASWFACSPPASTSSRS